MIPLHRETPQRTSSGSTRRMNERGVRKFWLIKSDFWSVHRIGNNFPKVYTLEVKVYASTAVHFSFSFPFPNRLKDEKKSEKRTWGS